MNEGGRRSALAVWLANDLPTCFAERILPIDHAVAERWSDLMAQSRRSGFALAVMDGFFAATALANGLTAGHAQCQGFRAVQCAAIQSAGR